MRALLVGGAPAAGTPALLRSLASTHDLIIGVDSGAETLESAGVRVDMIVGDLDSLAEDTGRRLEQGGSRLVRFPSDKDVSDLDLSLSVAREAGAAVVTVTAAFSRRLDHTLASLGSLARAADLMPEIVEPDLRGWLLHHEHRSRLTLHSVGATVSLFSMIGEAVVSCEGFVWPLERHRLEPLSSLGLSNRVARDPARIRVHAGCVAVLSADSCDTDMVGDEAHRR